ncbi:MAG TPA: hypothetical protein VF276_10130 [Chloroflexia bacterium]
MNRPYEDEDEPTAWERGVNCQPVFIDRESDEDQTQANGDEPARDDWRRWDE